MKIAFFSNFLNHHQLPFCQALLEMDGVEFKFVACEKTHEERLQMGYADMNNEYGFVVRAYEDEEEAQRIAQTYDVVMIGDAPVKYLDLRMEKGLLTFRCSERSLKKGTWRRFIPRTRKKIYNGYTKYKDKSLYVLGASAYTASDLVLCGFDKEKCFTWGYFPKAKDVDVQGLFEQKKSSEVPTVLYAGRLLKLKHVMDTVKAVHNLIKNGTFVRFTIIGEGECENKIRKYIEKNKLEKYITMLPFMSPEEVRTYMDKSDIYVFGSNFYEGWGAVVNEAMNSCCAVVVSHAVGSSACLIDNGKNGFVYEFANVEQLTQILSMLVEKNELRCNVGKEAYKTLKSTWSAETAAERFYELCKELLAKGDGRGLYASGPCSPARILKNDWIKNTK